MRMFLGLSLGQTIKTTLANAQGYLQGGSLVHPEDFHLTLRFLGDVSKFRLHDLEAELMDVNAAAFDLELSGLGVFAKGQQVRALWVGIRPSQELMLLQGKIERACQQAGFEPERRNFKPHITLARYRHRHIDQLAPEMAVIEPMILGTVTVTDYVLFRSFLGGDGPHYQAWQRFALTDYAALWPD